MVKLTTTMVKIIIAMVKMIIAMVKLTTTMVKMIIAKMTPQRVEKAESSLLRLPPLPSPYVLRDLCTIVIPLP